MNGREACAIAFAIIFLLVFCLLLTRAPGTFEAAPMVPEPAGAALWKGRTFEVILQGFIVLAGAVSILLLVSSRGREGSS